jgi:hypothetical protein
MLRWWTILGIFAFLSVIAMSQAGATSEPPKGWPYVPDLIADGGFIKIGDEAPNFLLRDVEGFQVSLDQYRGKVILLNSVGGNSKFSRCRPIRKGWWSRDRFRKKWALRFRSCMTPIFASGCDTGLAHCP